MPLSSLKKLLPTRSVANGLLKDIAVLYIKISQ